MHRPDNRVDRWRGLRAIGRVVLALAGGGVFAFLAWQPRRTHDAPAQETGADRHEARGRLAAADRESAAALRPQADTSEGMASRRSGPVSPGMAAIEPKGRPDATWAPDAEAAAGASKDERTRVTTIAEGSGRSNPMASPRGPP